MPHTRRKQRRPVGPHATEDARTIPSEGARNTVKSGEHGTEPEAEPEDTSSTYLSRKWEGDKGETYHIRVSDAAAWLGYSPESRDDGDVSDDKRANKELEEPCPWKHCVAKEESFEDTQSSPDDPRFEPKIESPPEEIELRILLEAAVSKATERPGESSDSDSDEVADDEGLRFRPPPGLSSTSGLPHTPPNTSTDDMPALDTQPTRAPGGTSSAPPLPSPSAGLDLPSGGPPQSLDAESRTTLQFRNLPYLLSRNKFVEMLNAHGCRGQFDLVYLPMDFKTNQSLGYGFVNAVNSQAALHFFRIFEGFQAWPTKSSKECSVCWSSNQGLDYNVKVYRNMTIMKEQFPEEWKPALFVQGIQVPFPAPTRKKRFRGKQDCGAVGNPAPIRRSATLLAALAEHPDQPTVHTKLKSNRTGHSDNREAELTFVGTPGDTESKDAKAAALAEHPVQPAVHIKLKSNRTGHSDNRNAESTFVGITGDTGTGDVKAAASAEHPVQPAVYTKLKSNRTGHSDNRNAESTLVGIPGDTGPGDVKIAALAAHAATGRPEGPLDGRWSDSWGAVVTIVGSTVHWAHQADDSVGTTHVSCTGGTVQMDFLGHALSGVLRDGQIVWSNSDVWWRND